MNTPTKAAELAEKLDAILNGPATTTTAEAAAIREAAALLRASEGPAVTTDNQSTRAGDGGPAPFGWALVCNNGTTADFRPRVHDFFGAIQEHEAFTVEDVRRRDADWAGLAPHRIVALYGSAPAMAESPCQFAIDGGGNLYRRYREPVCAGCVPVKKLTDKWESARVADFNSGWNACREAMLTAAPHPPAQQAAISDEALREIYAKHELAGANLVLSDLRRIAVDVLAMASPPPHKAEGAEPFEVRIAGPDDVIPFADELSAHRHANAVNQQHVADCLKHPDDHVLCVATVHATTQEPSA